MVYWKRKISHPQNPNFFNGQFHDSPSYLIIYTHHSHIVHGTYNGPNTQVSPSFDFVCREFLLFID